MNQIISTDIKGTVAEVIKRTYNVKSVRISLPDAERIPYRAGQYLLVKDLDGLTCNKALSISSSPTEGDYIEFTKKLTSSEFSQKLDQLTPGKEITFRYPFGSFTLDESLTKIAFLSGGIGITPVRSIMKCIVDSKLAVDVCLLYGNHSSQDIVFREDFLEMKMHTNFKIVNVLCEHDNLFSDRQGYITKDVIEKDVYDIQDRTFFICGPPGMVTKMKEILEELAIPQTSIVTEKFAGYE